jgi:carboxymethylenebutenolidase
MRVATAAPTATAFEAALAGFPSTTARMVNVETPDGRADGFFVTPKKGKHPGVVMWPDIAGLREAFMTMAARLASEGYAVLAVNQYYRSARFPVFGSFAEWRTDEGKARITSMKAAIPLDGIARDGAAFVSWLDRQPEVETKKKIACTGYCTTGSYTFRAAAAVPERVGVIASFHGTDLVTSESTSPHLLLFKTKKLCALVCIAQNDDEREPATKKTLRRAAESARAAAEIEVYPAQHGFCPLDSPVYDGPQAEKAWARMLYRFERYL